MEKVETGVLSTKCSLTEINSASAGEFSSGAEVKKENIFECYKIIRRLKTSVCFYFG